jgi:hypothetical protein
MALSMRNYLIRILPYSLLIGLICLGISACNKATRTPVQVQQSPDALNRVEHASSVPPKNFLHKTFKLASYEKFEFEVPAHIAAPRLQGSFKSSIAGQSSDGFSNAGNIDMLLMKPEEFEEFTHGRGGAPSYSIAGVHSQDVDYILPATLEEPQKYYLVFQNPAPKGPTKSVDADFTATF